MDSDKLSQIKGLAVMVRGFGESSSLGTDFSLATLRLIPCQTPKSFGDDQNNLYFGVDEFLNQYISLFVEVSYYQIRERVHAQNLQALRERGLSVATIFCTEKDLEHGCTCSCHSRHIS
jgi:hypothetical protein